MQGNRGKKEVPPFTVGLVELFVPIVLHQSLEQLGANKTAAGEKDQN
jgi:hypothetical protein